NLVHRKKLRPNGVAFKAERAADEQSTEFIASTDTWFRPVTFANAPDGALYIIDMYREVVEHPWSLPANIKQHLDLNSGNDRGRIYRAVGPEFHQPALPRLSKSSSRELVNLLAHPNGWHRDTASRLLYERQDRSVLPAIRSLLHSTPSSYGQIHALYALKSLGALEASDLLTSLKSSHAEVRQNGVRILAQTQLLDSELEKELTRMVHDPARNVRFQLAWTMATLSFDGKRDALKSLAKSAVDPWERHAALAAVSRDPSLATAIPEAFHSPRRTNPKPAAPALPLPTSSRIAVLKEYTPSLSLKGDAAKGKLIYGERCASCHRLFGQGTPVGPDLESVRAAGKESLFNNILDPNREIAQRFGSVEVKTKAGEEVIGIVANDAPNGITLRQANGIDLFVPRTQLEILKATSSSLMPEGLEAGLSSQDFANLLAYISGEP
ncbi:MAG TPA: HEAT repeat domain-containing protein, partial [Verrucomicrobiae bacterium]|nr:HEAT repeat domain-containing protein [Verrucomicrobiae bacterium]